MQSIRGPYACMQIFMSAAKQMEDGNSVLLVMPCHAVNTWALRACMQIFMSAAKQMKDGKTVSPSWISGNLLRCMVLNIAGVGLIALGLSAAMGERDIHAALPEPCRGTRVLLCTMQHECKLCLGYP